jgi:hypothetical protein
MKQTNQCKEHKNEIKKHGFNIEVIPPWKITRQHTFAQERPIYNEIDKN